MVLPKVVEVASCPSTRVVASAGTSCLHIIVEDTDFSTVVARVAPVSALESMGVWPLHLLVAQSGFGPGKNRQRIRSLVIGDRSGLSEEAYELVGSVVPLGMVGAPSTAGGTYAPNRALAILTAMQLVDTVVGACQFLRLGSGPEDGGLDLLSPLLYVLREGDGLMPGRQRRVMPKADIWRVILKDCPHAFLVQQASSLRS